MPRAVAANASRLRCRVLRTIADLEEEDGAGGDRRPALLLSADARLRTYLSAGFVGGGDADFWRSKLCRSELEFWGDAGGRMPPLMPPLGVRGVPGMGSRAACAAPAGVGAGLELVTMGVRLEMGLGGELASEGRGVVVAVGAAREWVSARKSEGFWALECASSAIWVDSEKPPLAAMGGRRLRGLA